MLFRSALAALTLLATLPLAAAAEPGRLVAVLEFRNKLRGAEKDEVDAGYLADLVRSSILDHARAVQVMTRENVTVLLQSQGKKLEDCEGECEVDTGRRLGADYIVSGEVLKFGSSFKVNLKLHETQNGRLLAGQQVSGANIDELDRNTPAAVQKLIQPLQRTAPPLVERREPKPDVTPPVRRDPPPDRNEPRTQPRVAQDAVRRDPPPVTPTRAPTPADEKREAFHSGVQGVIAHVSDPEPCRSIVVTSCNATSSGWAFELHARGSAHIAGPLRVGLGGGVKYESISLESSLTALPSSETTALYLVGSAPVTVGWGDLSLGWVPCLQLHVAGDDTSAPAFKYNRFEASYGSDFKIAIVAEAPIGGHHLLIGGAITLEL